MHCHCRIFYIITAIRPMLHQNGQILHHTSSLPTYCNHWQPKLIIPRKKNTGITNWAQPKIPKRKLASHFPINPQCPKLLNIIRTTRPKANNQRNLTAHRNSFCLLGCVFSGSRSMIFRCSFSGHIILCCDFLCCFSFYLILCLFYYLPYITPLFSKFDIFIIISQIPSEKKMRS